MSSLLYTNGEDDWSEILEKTPPSAVAPSNQVSETISENPAEKKRQISMPILPSYNEPVKPVTTKEEAEETTQLVWKIRISKLRVSNFSNFEFSNFEISIMQQIIWISMQKEQIQAHAGQFSQRWRN